ncbi:hypothetical protein HD806DRAFT_536642 [Xylariaceae sp. AK1471]|nr:hypothetical protein HD806DRAFT_536642 [Xylariaceae sp. AK1471]
MALFSTFVDALKHNGEPSILFIGTAISRLFSTGYDRVISRLVELGRKKQCESCSRSWTRIFLRSRCQRTPGEADVNESNKVWLADALASADQSFLISTCTQSYTLNYQYDIHYVFLRYCQDWRSQDGKGQVIEGSPEHQAAKEKRGSTGLRTPDTSGGDGFFKVSDLSIREHVYCLQMQNDDDTGGLSDGSSNEKPKGKNFNRSHSGFTKAWLSFLEGELESALLSPRVSHIIQLVHKLVGYALRQ